MRAYQLIERGRAEMRDIPTPEPGAGEVLIEVVGAGVCHSDLHLIHEAPFKRLPMTLGHEISGRIAKSGPGVELSAGTPVLGYLCWGCGRCRTCAAGYENYCEAFRRGITPGPGLGFPGAMADFVVFPASYVVPISEQIDLAAAAPLTDAALTPWHAINSCRDRLTAASTAVVIGIGGLGHMAVQILRETTGARIIAVDVDSARLAHARELGAEAGITSSPDSAAEILELTKGRGADVVFDFVGVRPTLALATDAIAPRGAIVMVGLGGSVLEFPAAGPPKGLPWGVSVSKPYGGTRSELHDLLKLAERGRLSVAVEKHPLADAAVVFSQLEAGQVAGRAVLMP